MQDRKKFKIVDVFSGPEYDLYNKGNDISDAQIVLQGETYIKPLEEEHSQEIKLKTKSVKIGIDEDILSKHILIIGGIGMGKTNTFLSATEQLVNKCTSKDFMLIFDTKGDFYNTFGDINDKNDIFISNAPLKDANGNEKNSSEAEIWNIFNELGEEKLAETAHEIAGMVFADLLKKSSQPFFPMAAREIFTSVLRSMARRPELFKSKLSNKLLKEFFDGKDVWAKSSSSDDLDAFLKGTVKPSSVLTNIVELLINDEQERGVINYLSPNGKVENNGQSQGIIAELRLVVDQLFVGNFAKEGSFSIRNAVRERGGKKIYIQYDITEGNTLAPIYSLLVDLAIKESLETRSAKKGNAYFIVDEFKLLPNLRHLDDAVNFGRSIGVKFIIGVQNVSQIIENYGQDNAMNILSGFSTVIAYRVTDSATRKYLVELFGQNQKKTTYLSAISSRGVIENLERTNVVEDWDILNLGVGECIIRLAKKYGKANESNPIFLKVKAYKKGGEPISTDKSMPQNAMVNMADAKLQEQPTVKKEQPIQKTENTTPITENGDIIIEGTAVAPALFRRNIKIKNAIIPEGVLSIGNGAFEDCKNLVYAKIPNTVISIGDFAFRDCSSLVIVEMGNSVTYIGNAAFMFCSAIESIIYYGTKAQWERIEKGTAWKNGIAKLNVKCVDGDIVY